MNAMITRTTRGHIRECLGPTIVAILLAIVLPLIGIGLFLFRGVALAIAIVAVLGLVACRILAPRWRNSAAGETDHNA